MADVPKVSRATVERVRAWYDENDPEAHGQTFEHEDQVRALCALAELLVEAEEDGTLDMMRIHLEYDEAEEREPIMVPTLARIRAALLDVEER